MPATDVCILAATPGGLMAALAAARRGHRVVVLERGRHLGGLPANGLGATDIATRAATRGLFRQFVERVRAHYVAAHGADSAQVRDCSDGYHFEPHVAEAVLEAMVAEQPNVTVLRRRQFDARPENVGFEAGRLARVTVTNLDTGDPETYTAGSFIDASYEGDLAAAAGAPFRTRREGQAETGEPLAGRVYKRWGGEVCEGSTFEGDDTIQAYNYRLCLTSDPANLVAFERPASYRREEYASIADDVRLGRWTGVKGDLPWGIARLTSMVKLPNGKVDANNQHFAFVSTDLPEENYPWPTADWAWRDAFAQRLRDYTLGLFWFAQHDEALPEDFRAAALKWGLAADEYPDNGHFPRQVYVREGRRIEGRHLFTGHDALPTEPGGRPPVHADSVTASHYPIDSHAHRKREPNRCHLDGFLSHATAAYTVPYGVMVPQQVEGLLTPVPVSATHLGFGTLRMEPCWMALGEAAGTAAAIALEDAVPPSAVTITKVQRALIEAGAVLIHYRDASPGDVGWRGLQLLGLRGLVPGWEAKLAEPADEAELERWCAVLDVARPAGRTRGEVLEGFWGVVG